MNAITCSIMIFSFLALVWFTICRPIDNYQADRTKRITILAVLIISWLCWLIPWDQPSPTTHCQNIKTKTPTLLVGDSCYVSLNPEGTLFLREGDQRVHVYTVEEIKLD